MTKADIVERIHQKIDFSKKSLGMVESVKRKANRSGGIRRPGRQLIAEVQNHR